MKKIGVIKESKEPSDARVVITPELCQKVIDMGFELVVQRATDRAIPDSAYEQLGINLVDDVDDCDILIGVKEVKEDKLIPNKTYFFFSHTHKEQVYNRSLLRTVINKNIRLYDYEVLTNDNGARLIAFGKFAGMVGAHNALWTYNQRHQSFNINRMYTYPRYLDAVADYKKMTIPPVKIVLTGTGRVGNGAATVLRDMGIKEVEANAFIENKYDHPVFVQLSCDKYVTPKDGSLYETKDFYKNPLKYKSIFTPFTQHADIMINGIYWDGDAPAFFTKSDMRKADFNIKTIADVTCDIAPESSIPSTLYPSTIEIPVFTYDTLNEGAVKAYSIEGVDMMTVDNLPAEMAADASQEFGSIFVEKILPELLKEKSDILDRACICKDGKLGKHFEYLSDFLDGK